MLRALAIVVPLTIAACSGDNTDVSTADTTSATRDPGLEYPLDEIPRPDDADLAIAGPRTGTVGEPVTLTLINEHQTTTDTVDFEIYSGAGTFTFPDGTSGKTGAITLASATETSFTVTFTESGPGAIGTILGVSRTNPAVDVSIDVEIAA